MTAARLSPAASLLRNSKLFALPPAIALPNPEPSSEPVPRSDTATTIYPTRAAIETPLTSLGKGDWGFKRALPLKSTVKSGSPSVRLNKGIDTAEHIADFDSAADHVLTLKKFQELNQSIQHPQSGRNESKHIHHGVFRRNYDNTTNLSETAPARTQYSGVWPSLSPSEIQKILPEALRPQSEEATAAQGDGRTQPAKASNPYRWRFDGPSLIQMSGLEFDQWMRTLDSSKRTAFREAVKQDLLAKKRSSHVVKAQDEGTVGEVDAATLQVSEEELTQYMRKLRQQPNQFGRLIAEFLDLPAGPSGQNLRVKINDVWNYGRRTLASESYAEAGPPRMHPSAGLSYVQSARWAPNHAVFGPQDQRLPVVARAVKTRGSGNRNNATLGVAGFIVEKKAHSGTIQANTPAYEPRPGGQKITVRPENAEINEKGALKLYVKPTAEYQVENETAVHNSMISDASVAALRPTKTVGQRVMKPLTRNSSNVVDYKKREDLSSGGNDGDFDFLDKTS